MNKQNTRKTLVITQLCVSLRYTASRVGCMCIRRTFSLVRIFHLEARTRKWKARKYNPPGQPVHIHIPIDCCCCFIFLRNYNQPTRRVKTHSTKSMVSSERFRVGKFTLWCLAMPTSSHTKGAVKVTIRSLFYWWLWLMYI